MAIKSSGITIVDEGGDRLRFVPDYTSGTGHFLTVCDDDGTLVWVTREDAQALGLFLTSWVAETA